MLKAIMKIALVLKALLCPVLLLSVQLSYAQSVAEPARRQLFNNNWKFFQGDSMAFKERNLDDAHWRTLDLPHDWSIEGKVHPRNPSGGAGGYFPTGVGWYRKSFRVPAGWKGKKLSIYFEGVYMNAEVFVNGTSMGAYPYGYSSFRHDMSTLIDYGKENTIAVRVDNAQQPNCRWYAGSGIYRNVWLTVTDPVHVADTGLFITSSVQPSGKALVKLRVTVKNETPVARKIALNTTLTDKTNKRAGFARSTIVLPAYSQKDVAQEIPVAGARLWTPETPHLYRARVSVLANGKMLDNMEAGFGIRSIDFTPEHGFRLNGKTVKLNGGCVHHDNGCLGAAAYDRAEQRKVELLKAAGFNAVRTAHNPPSEAFLDACDSLGLLVIDEAFDGWRAKKTPGDYALFFDQWWRKDLEAMVLRDRNHPSVIMWSIGNEVVERGEPQAVETAKMLAAAVKRTDGTRPVISAVVNNGKAWSAFDPLMAAHDVAGYNYNLNSAPDDHKRVPSRMIIQTESYPKDAFINWKLVQENNYIIGDFVWTAMDYLGESGIGRWYISGETPGEHWENDFFPWHGAYCGDIDLTGWRKPISHYRSMLYNPGGEQLYMAVREPVQAPFELKNTWWSVWPTWESWTWPGFEGNDMHVEVYSRYPAVRLYLDDKIIGEKATTGSEEFIATFTLPYAPGALKAIGLLNGTPADSTMIRTAGRAASIQLKANRQSIVANGQDLTYVNIAITDSLGVFQPNAGNRLHFEVEGPATIAGVDNADLKDTDPYQGNTRKAWRGRALVVLKSLHTAGEVTLKVSAEGLGTAVLKLNAN
ncbi:MAG: glycoside hydrolase family 2 TIM barrel-domain containing protein [Chitinophagaceae bacterium]